MNQSVSWNVIRVLNVDGMKDSKALGFGEVSPYGYPLKTKSSIQGGPYGTPMNGRK